MTATFTILGVQPINTRTAPPGGRALVDIGLPGGVVLRGIIMPATGRRAWRLRWADFFMPEGEFVRGTLVPEELFAAMSHAAIRAADARGLLEGGPR